MDVNSDGTKAMTWPLDYYRPGQTDEPEANDAVRQRILSAQQDTDEETNEVVVVTVPSRVVAVRIFGDALIEPMVRRVDGELRSLLRRDGLLKLEEEVSSSILPPPTLTFAQYDAVYSMGQRRSEVHIPLPDGSHPW